MSRDGQRFKHLLKRNDWRLPMPDHGHGASCESTTVRYHPDVACLVNVFYDRVRDDDVLGPIFDDIAHVDWATHLPRIYDFWESMLFARATFKAAPLVVHRALLNTRH